MRASLPLSLLVAIGLSACGGGDAPHAHKQGTTDFTARVHALQATAPGPVTGQAIPTVDARALFDWAEFKYPSLFPKGPQNVSLVHEGVSYTVRAYPGGTYLGLTEEGQVYGLGDFTGGVLKSFGQLSDFNAQIQADRCAVNPGSCNANLPLGPLNECFMPASQALAIGNRFRLSYGLSSSGPSGAGSGEMTIESRVEQQVSFEGQSAVQTSISTTLSETLAGQTTLLSSRSTYFAQAAPGDLILALGDEVVSEAQQPQGRIIYSMRRVHQPAYLNSEATLSVGQSLTRSLSAMTTSSTTISGVALPPSSGLETLSETHAFEARETIRVQGRSHDTCRYRESDPTSPGDSTVTWFLVGKGIPVRAIASSGQSTQTTELKSGSLNDQPL